MSFMKINGPHPHNNHNNQNNQKKPFFAPRPQLKNKEENKGVQAKLKVGSSNDKYEMEADKTADQVVDYSKRTVIGPSCPITSKPPGPESIQRRIQQIGKGYDPSKKAKPMTPEQIQRKISQMGRNSPDFSNYRGSQTESKLNSTKGKGSKMDDSTKNEMESGFGRDFSDVNIHTGPDAVQMNQELGAKAFTNGNDVYFNKGEYNPKSDKGKHLLAHELTHTVQQGKNSGTNETIQRDIKDKSANVAVSNGQFEIDMEATSAFDKKKDNKEKRTGERGFIYFTPSPKSTVTNDVGLIQIVRTTTVKKVKEEGKKIEKEVNSTWYKGEADRMKMRTSATDQSYTTVKNDTLKSIVKAETADHVTTKELYDLNAATLGKFDENEAIPEGTVLAMPGSEEGYFMDHKATSSLAEPRQTTADPDVSMLYKDYFPGVSNVNGHKNSYQTLPASIGDWPGIGGKKTNMSYKFETVARSIDQGFDYGTLFWGFDAKEGVVTNEYHYVKDGTSSTFKSAVAEFNKFYGNHHTLVKGETLESLAKLYLGDEKKSVDIEKANPSMLIEITPGQKLTIPGEKYPHEVGKGDTVEGLALRYLKDENKTADIEKANPSMTTRIALGQKIIIPGITNETKP